MRRGEYAASVKAYLGTLRDTLQPMRRQGEEQIKAGLRLLLEGWSLLDAVDRELNQRGGYGAVKAHLTAEQLGLILTRPLEQAGIGPVAALQENKHAAD